MSETIETNSEQEAAVSTPEPDGGQTSRRASRLERILLSEGVVTEEALQAARERQKGAKRPLLEVLVEQAAVDEAEVVRVLAAGGDRDEAVLGCVHGHAHHGPAAHHPRREVHGKGHGLVPRAVPV